ncbi:MAG: hypothetical protein LC655_07960, partial [Bacteroidales bacterium]|nr:hypothetical protein [Bacteroidales bacterium]
MKVLTIQSVDKLSPENQRVVNSVLRMEYQSDYIFKDENHSQYSATISLENPTETINTIISNSAQLPEYTLIVNILDADAGEIEQLTIRNGTVEHKKSGSWEWSI